MCIDIEESLAMSWNVMCNGCWNVPSNNNKKCIILLISWLLFWSHIINTTRFWWNLVHNRWFRPKRHSQIHDGVRPAYWRSFLRRIGGLTRKPIVLFQWNFVWGSNFFRISAMSQIPAFHRTYICCIKAYLVYLPIRWRHIRYCQQLVHSEYRLAARSRYTSATKAGVLQRCRSLGWFHDGSSHAELPKRLRTSDN